MRSIFFLVSVCFVGWQAHAGSYKSELQRVATEFIQDKCGEDRELISFKHVDEDWDYVSYWAEFDRGYVSISLRSLGSREVQHSIDEYSCSPYQE